jgi:hypothetical protein
MGLETVLPDIHVRKNNCGRKRDPVFLKKPGLSEFSGIIKARFIVGENPLTMRSAEPVKLLRNPERTDNPVRLPDGGKINVIRSPSRADNIYITLYTGMK